MHDRTPGRSAAGFDPVSNGSIQELYPNPRLDNYERKGLAGKLPKVNFDRLEEAVRRIALLDLDRIEFRLARPDEGPALSNDAIKQARMEYVQFLALTFTYPETIFVPTLQADLFWHQHILDTRAYAQDCVRLFGFFLHHFPLFGLRGEDDAKALHQQASVTAAMSQIHFGSSAVSGANCGGGSCSSCSA